MATGFSQTELVLRPNPNNFGPPQQPPLSPSFFPTKPYIYLFITIMDYVGD